MELNEVEYIKFIKNYIKKLDEAYLEQFDTFGDSRAVYDVIHEIVGIFKNSIPDIEDRIHYNNNFLEVDVEICKASLQILIMQNGGRLEEDNETIRFARCLYANLFDKDFIYNYIKPNYYQDYLGEIEYSKDLKYWFEIKYGIIYSEENKFDMDILIKVIELFYDELVDTNRRYDYTIFINNIFSKFYLNYRLEKGCVSKNAYLTSNPIVDELDSFNIENKMRYSNKLIVSRDIEAKKVH